MPSMPPDACTGCYCSMHVRTGLDACRYGLLLWYAAKRVRDGACTPEAAVQAAWCVVIAGMALGQAVPDVAQVDEGRRAGARLQAVLARAPPSGALDAGAALQKPLLVRAAAGACCVGCTACTARWSRSRASTFVCVYA